MRGKTAKKLRRLAKSLLLTRGETDKLKADWNKTPNRNLAELETIMAKVDENIAKREQDAKVSSNDSLRDNQSKEGLLSGS